MEQVKDNKTVIIFNAPPSAGKDVAASFMKDYFQTGEVIAFKDELYEDTAEYFNIDFYDLIVHHNDRELKELPDLQFPKYQSESVKQYLFSLLYVMGILLNSKYLMSLGYYSSRQALIHVSENVVKPTKGEDYYGRKLADEIDSSSERFYFVADGGFLDEATAVVEKGYDVYIVQIERSGATFDGDSRSLLNKDDFKEYSNIKFIKLDNNGTLDDLYNTIVDLSYDVLLKQTKDKYGGDNNEYEVVHI